MVREDIVSLCENYVRSRDEAASQRPAPAVDPAPELVVSNPQEEFELVMLQENELHPGFKHSEREKQQSEVVIEQLPNETLDEYLEKIRNFDADFKTDIFLNETNQKLLPTLARLDRVQNFVGHANFNLIGFEESLYFARNCSAVSANVVS